MQVYETENRQCACGTGISAVWTFFFQQAKEIQLKNTVSGLNHWKGRGCTKYIGFYILMILY